jgi:hypothetical protein
MTDGFSVILQSLSERTAEIKCAWGCWFVVPHDGHRGGIAVASYKDGLKFCEERGWRVVKEPK